MDVFKVIENIRTVPIQINGKRTRIAGFQRPENTVEDFKALQTQHKIGAVVSLDGDYSEVYKKSGMNPAFYTHGERVEIYDSFKEAKNEVDLIKASTFDAVFYAVEKAQKAKKKIAIHCGAGDGRTGTVLASLKLRELLEAENKRDPSAIADPQVARQTISVHHGANSNEFHDEKKKIYTEVTPVVRAAIAHVRRSDKSGHESVENVNEVASLVAYEKHLRQQIALRNSTTHIKQDGYAHATQGAGRFHTQAVDAKKFTTLKNKFKAMKGDQLKTNILIDVKNKLSSIETKEDLEQYASDFRQSDEYKVLEKPQGVTSQVLGCETGSVKLLNQMIADKEESLLRHGPSSSLMD